MKKRLLTLLLVIMMMLSLIPIVGNKVSADGDNPEFYAVYNTVDEGDIPAYTLYFCYDSNKPEAVGTRQVFSLPVSAIQESDWGYHSLRSSIKGVIINKNVKDYTGLTSTAYMFSNMENADDIQGCQYLNVMNVIRMTSMFYRFGYYSTSIDVVPDVANFNTSKVTSMVSMFHEYAYSSTKIIKAPEVSHWDTSKVTKMTSMFYNYAYSSTNISDVPDVTIFNTSNVTSMNEMFYGYAYSSNKTLEYLDISLWNIDALSSANKMFSNYAYSNNLGSPVVYGSDWSVISEATGTDMFVGSKLKGNTTGNFASANTSDTGCFTRKPLTFKANTSNSKVTLSFVSGNNIQVRTSIDDGSSWSDWSNYTKGETITLSNIGDLVQFKGNGILTDNDNHFMMSGSILASGDVTSLINGVGGDIDLVNNNFQYMFYGCTALNTIPNLPSTKLGEGCYQYMFAGCSNIKLSITQEDRYLKPNRIPTSGTGTKGTDSLLNMFNNTGGTFTGTPNINTTYYLWVEHAIQTLSFASSSITKEYGDASFINELSGAKTKVTYTSDNPDVAIVNSLTGEVTIKGAGSATIKASAEKTVVHLKAEASYTLTVTKKQLTVKGTTVANKKYDGTTTANVTIGLLEGVIEGDEVTLKIKEANFSDKNVGDSIAVAVSYKLDGKDASNYLAPNDDSLIANITKRQVTLTSGSAYKYYEVGVPLRYEVVSESGDGFVSGEGAKYSYFREIDGRENSTEVAYNSFIYNLNKDTTSYKNYDITTVFGTLTMIASKRDDGDMPYDITNGFKATYTKGSAPILTAHTYGVLGFSVSVLDNDGNELNKDKDYTVTNGSIKINLQPSYLNSLSIGIHVLTIKVDVVSYKVTLTVNAPYVPVNTSTSNN